MSNLHPALEQGFLTDSDSDGEYVDKRASVVGRRQIDGIRSSEALKTSAELAIQNGSWDEAIDLYTQAINGLNTLSSNELKSTEIALVRTALYGGRAKCYSKIGEAELADLDLDKALSIEGHGDFTSQGPRGKSAPAAGASSTQLLMLIGILVVLLLAVVVKRMTKSAASTE